ncbi:hypothetical protein CYY_000697 [Polysphondylium violaceum]|uniref:Uncharacterized protein n=1 Tax=Polysphondylium violaceum TaxID=133409 RepID=A0A8J4PZA6_9MYCE|nr:hypothetical protein CYY_000697 [Polysphondylium violaceum]
MCIAFISFDQFSEFPLIILDNRDEKIDRPTISLSEWELGVGGAGEDGVSDQPKIRIFGGRDKLGGGTWFAISDRGKFCVLLNSYSKNELFGQLKPLVKITRGKIISDYLLLDVSPLDYINKHLESQRDSYLPFKIIIGDIKTKENYFYDSHHYLGSKPAIEQEPDKLFLASPSSSPIHIEPPLLVPGSSVDSDQDHIVSPLISPTLTSVNFNNSNNNKEKDSDNDKTTLAAKDLKSLTIKLSEQHQKMFGISNYPVHWNTFKVENGKKQFEKTLQTLFNENSNSNINELQQSSTTMFHSNNEKDKDDFIIDRLFQILINKETDSQPPAPFENINTASIFVNQYQSKYTGSTHATVSSSILLVDKNLNAKFVEWDHIHSSKHLVQFQIQ